MPPPVIGSLTRAASPIIIRPSATVHLRGLQVETPPRINSIFLPLENVVSTN